MDTVHTSCLGLTRTATGPARIPHVFAISQCSQGLESRSSPTSGTANPPSSEGGFCFNVLTIVGGQVPLTLAAGCAWRRGPPVWLWGGAGSGGAWLVRLPLALNWGGYKFLSWFVRWVVVGLHLFMGRGGIGHNMTSRPCVKDPGFGSFLK